MCRISCDNLAKPLAYTAVIAAASAAIPSLLICGIMNSFRFGIQKQLIGVGPAEMYKDHPINNPNYVIAKDLECTAIGALGSAAVVTGVVALALIAIRCCTHRR